MRAEPRTLQPIWCPLCAPIPCLHPCVPVPCAHSHVPISAYSRPVFSRPVYARVHVPCLLFLWSLCAFVPIPCPLLFTNAYLCPLSLMPPVSKSCALVSPPKTKAASAYTPYRPKRSLLPALTLPFYLILGASMWCLVSKQSSL